MFLKIVFPTLFLVGLYFLFKNIGRIIRLYSGKKIEFSATNPKNSIQLEKAGEFEIAVKRRGIFGEITTQNFKLINEDDQNEIIVRNSINIFGQRKDMSGNRIVPIAEFTITEPGEFLIINPDIDQFRANDKLLITSKTGSKGFILIFAILFSAIMTIGGLVLSILAFTNKLQF